MTAAQYPTAGELLNGFTTHPRGTVNTSGGATVGYLVLTGFIAPQTMTATNVGFYIVGANTITLCEIGIYQLDSANNAFLMRGTPDLSSLVTGVTGYVQATLGAGGVSLIAGRPYAIAMLINGAAPTLASAASIVYSGTEVPFFSTFYPFSGGLTALPINVPYSQVDDLQYAFYFEITY